MSACQECCPWGLPAAGKTEGGVQGFRTRGWRGVGRCEGALQTSRWRGRCSREGAGRGPSPTTAQRPPAARCCPDAQGGAVAWMGARLHGAAWRALLKPSPSQRGRFKLPRVLRSWPMAPVTFRDGGHLLREAFPASCPPIRPVPGLGALGAGTGTSWGTRTRLPGRPALLLPPQIALFLRCFLPWPSAHAPPTLCKREASSVSGSSPMEPSPGTWACSRHVYATNGNGQLPVPIPHVLGLPDVTLLTLSSQELCPDTSG